MFRFVDRLLRRRNTASVPSSSETSSPPPTPPKSTSSEASSPLSTPPKSTSSGVSSSPSPSRVFTTPVSTPSRASSSLPRLEHVAGTHCWYTDDMIHALLQHYVDRLGRGGRLVDVVFPIRADEVLRGGDVFLRNLREAEDAAYRNHVSTIIVPINLGGNHWVALQIVRNIDNLNPVQLNYYDPMGTPIPKKLVDMLIQVYIGADINNIRIRLQHDGYNCGPWVVEILRNWLEHPDFIPEEDLDMDVVRREHEQILFPGTVDSPVNVETESDSEGATPKKSSRKHSRSLSPPYTEEKSTDASDTGHAIKKLRSKRKEEGLLDEIKTSQAVVRDVLGNIRRSVGREEREIKNICKVGGEFIEALAQLDNYLKVNEEVEAFQDALNIEEFGDAVSAFMAAGSTENDSEYRHVALEEARGFVAKINRLLTQANTIVLDDDHHQNGPRRA